jgi:DNA-binding FadR family transcriptional regulator
VRKLASPSVDGQLGPNRYNPLLDCAIRSAAESPTHVSSKRLRFSLPAGEASDAAVFHPSRALRSRVADRVFDALLRAILQGGLKPGQAVPTQRQLSMEFGVSPLIVRQAIHRLEELELVRVRQGSTTIVLDPNEAADVRLIQLQMEVATPGDALSLAGVENRALMTLPLIVLAERRISEEELAELDALVENQAASPNAEMLEFQALYWEKIAAATRNPLLRHQVRWWFKTSHSFAAGQMLRPALKADHYRELNKRLRARKGSVELWLTGIRRLLERTEALPGHTLAQGLATAKRRVPRQAPARAAAKPVRSR